MLSKIYSDKDSQELSLKAFSPPTLDEIGGVMAERQREMQRSKVIEENPEDPVKGARQEANKILLEAQEKLKEAEVEASLMKVKKEKQLRSQLEKEFQAKLEQQLSQLQNSYQESLEEIGKLKERLYEKSEQDLMTLVFSVAHKVIDEEIKATPETVLKMLKKGFSKIKEAKQFEIKVNPADYDLMQRKKQEIGDILQGAGNITFTQDEHIQRGGCHIITEHGEISSEPGKQLDIIMRELSNGA